MARKRRGRSEGSIFFRADKGLWVTTMSLGYDAAGKRRRRTIYGATKQEVQQKLRELQTSVDAGHIPEPSKLTVGQYLTTWLDSVKPTVAAYTHREYDAHARRYLQPHLGGVKIKELTSLHVQQLYADLAKDDVSASMQRKAGVTLGVALQSAVRLGVIASNPARGVKKPRVEKQEIATLDPDQLKAFLHEAEQDRLCAYYAAALDSGAREGELFGLYWSDLDFAASCIHIRRSLEETKDTLRVKDCKTKQSRRKITLSPFALDALQEHRKRMLAEGNYRADGPVFCDTRGGFLRKSNVLRRSFQPILKRAGLPHFRPYDLRHTTATLLLLAGENPKVVSERLGHGTIALTMDTYSHVTPTMQERAAEKMDAIFKATAPAKNTAHG